jgi:lysozyme
LWTLPFDCLQISLYLETKYKTHNIMLINTSSSAIIKAWQAFLNTKGYDAGTADGIWGPHTTAASKAFQSANQLVSDGQIGPRTIQVALDEGFIIPKGSTFEPEGTSNIVFDLSYHNLSPDFSQAYAAGMRALFHKATQHTTFVDPTYTDRRQEATDEGFYWGAYHFGTGGDGTAQAEYFLKHAKPDGKTLLALDFEPDTTKGQTNMTLDEARNFVTKIKEETGKYPGIYGGGYLKDLVRSQADEVLSNCWLWLSEYGPHAKLPNGWTEYAFWQYTDGKIGPGAVPIDGIGRCDRDLFKGTQAELDVFWLANAC